MRGRAISTSRTIATLVVLGVVVGCADKAAAPSTTDPGDPPAANGRRDRVVGAAAPICADATQAYVATQATAWWQQKIDPTRSGGDDGPYAYAQSKTDAPILQAVAGLHGLGVELKPEASAQRWRAAGDQARLTLEGQLTGEPGYLATFELTKKDEGLVVERFSLLRGSTTYTCESGRLVPQT